MAVACRKVYISDESFANLRAALSDSVIAYFMKTDGGIRLYSDDNSGTKLDTVDIYPKSREPSVH